MCDARTLEDTNRYLRGSGDLPPRRLGALSAAAGFAALMSRAANAVEVTGVDVEVSTPDGAADAYFVHPVSGAHAGVLIWPDAFGLRPAFKQMGSRLAQAGYSVLVVNPFYRTAKAPVVPEGANFQDEAIRNTVMPLMRSLTAATQTTDASAFVSFIDAQAAVDKRRKIGTAGYCMGGRITMRASAARADRIGAGASFHGGGLVTDASDSPHLLVPKMHARYLFAIAENDDTREPQAKDVLREGFASAGLPAEIEVYEGTLHGWCPPDSPVYNEAQAERGWSRMLALFATALA
jgi:carboxymethylenebutenolidase